MTGSWWLHWLGSLHSDFMGLSNVPAPQAVYTMFSACMVTASFYGTGKHEANLTEEAIIIAKRV